MSRKDDNIWGYYEESRDVSPIESGGRGIFGRMSNGFKATIAAVLLLPTIILGGKAVGAFGLGTRPKTVAENCMTNGPVEGCVKIIQDGGSLNVYGQLNSLRYHNKHSDPSSMLIDDVTLKDGAGNVLTQFQGDGSTYKTTVGMYAQPDYTTCLPYGATETAEIHGRFWDNGAWYPVSAATATTSDGLCHSQHEVRALGIDIGL